jgi:diguanylate cyclase (GGDEF)-like protein
LCRRIRQQQAATYQYIILLTGKSARGDLLKGMEAGADDYLTKPCDLEELQVRVRAGQRIVDLQTRLLQAQEDLRRQATHDTLTGIWNRGAILEILERELDRAQREQQPLGVIMADVDHFKSINDTYGHPAGDKVLHDVAQSIRSCLRPYDAVGRYGGEEFLVVLPKCTLSSAAEIAERIRHGLAQEPIATEKASVSISISLGVAAHEFKVGSTEKVEIEKVLIGDADAALYLAKQQGRNRVMLSHPRV